MRHVTIQTMEPEKIYLATVEQVADWVALNSEQDLDRGIAMHVFHPASNRVIGQWRSEETKRWYEEREILAQQVARQSAADALILSTAEIARREREIAAAESSAHWAAVSARWSKIAVGISLVALVIAALAHLNSTS